MINVGLIGIYRKTTLSHLVGLYFIICFEKYLPHALLSSPVHNAL